jgi:hypothetical protein
MNDPDLSRCSLVDMADEEPLAHLDAPIGHRGAPVRCSPCDASLIASNDEGSIFVVLREGEHGLFRRLSADLAREWAADLMRAANFIDQGKGKQ